MVLTGSEYEEIFTKEGYEKIGLRGWQTYNTTGNKTEWINTETLKMYSRDPLSNWKTI